MVQFRDRKIDVCVPLKIVRHQAKDEGTCSTPGASGSALQNLRNLSIETPTYNKLKWYTEFFEKRKYIVQSRYIRVAEERQKYPQTGLEYDLDEEDEEWLKSNKSRQVKDEDLENMLIRLEFALHATTQTQENERREESGCVSASASLPQESAIAILAANGFSELAYQDLMSVYKYWVKKRDEHSKPLLRCLQAPPALDDRNPYDLFCGRDKSGSTSSKHHKLKVKRVKVGCRSLWQAPQVSPAMPSSLQFVREDKSQPIKVVCGNAEGILLEGLRYLDEKIVCEGRTMCASDFVGLGLGELHWKWKAVVKVVIDGRPGPSLCEWLRVNGKQLGNAVLGRVISVYNSKLHLFKSGIIQDFDRTNGQHLIRYLDGIDEEWLHLPMEWIRWLPGKSDDFGIQVIKKVGRRTPLRTARYTAMHKGVFFNSKKALHFQLRTVQGWVKYLVQGAKRLAWSFNNDSTSELKHSDSLPPTVRPSTMLPPENNLVDAVHQSGPENPEVLPIIAGRLQGHLVSGCSQREEMILFEGEEIRPADFIAKSGPTLISKWTNVIQVDLRDECPGPTVGDWLRARGHEKGVTIVGKGLGVYRPENGHFDWGNVLAFDRLSGKHLIQYENGLREWLFLSIHFVKWISKDPPSERKKRRRCNQTKASKTYKRHCSI